jgi:murein L,D-transpeptidase YafK
MIKRFFSYLLFILIITVIVYHRYPERKLPDNAVVSRIIVFKSRRQMLVYADGELVNTYVISLGGYPVGKKQIDGDGRTPEGLYTINAKNPNSVCHKNLGVSYPDAVDISNAKRLGKSPGGDIKIHGVSNGWSFIGKFQRWYDWTNGCMGLTDAEVDDLYAHTAIGTAIEIRP